MNPSLPLVILAATDGTSASAEVVENAARFAAGHKSDAPVALHIVHAVVPVAVSDVVGGPVATQTSEAELAEGRGILDAACRSAGALFSGPVTSHLVRAEPVDAILETASRTRAAFLVVGSHDYKGLKRFFLGSVAEQVVRKAKCPVMVIRPIQYAESKVPTIEPLCPDCAHVREQTAGKSQWCARHSEHHVRALLHYEYPQGFAQGSQIIRPT